MNDRIKLCEAMGWTPLDLNLIGWWMPPGAKIDDHVFIINRKSEEALPDPFTDANDDYAVLEWMRKGLKVTEMERMLDWKSQVVYQIGDYARAALKVIE